MCSRSQACSYSAHCRAVPQWYYLLVTFLIVPFFSMANSYAAGLTDQDNSSIYGKLAILIFSAWAGTSGGGVIAGLGICGVVVAATSQAAVLMQARACCVARGLRRTNSQTTYPQSHC